ncbi:MAG TPA: VOC family protein [Stellaceae bacterium]|jgi:catechol 2,3-dioxygenase-like lactoylglutathione lyase family enzyme|nr:VOC family protein [Stellaceae bacterium]
MTAKLRHIAITVSDLKKEAAFFESVFGFKKHHENDVAVSLSDGVVNVTLLKFKTDADAGDERGKDFVGIHHIGFVVDDPKEWAGMDQKIKDNGGQFHFEGRAGMAVEIKYRDPHGIVFDISEPDHAWTGIKV